MELVEDLCSRGHIARRSSSRTCKDCANLTRRIATCIGRIERLEAEDAMLGKAKLQISTHSKDEDIREALLKRREILELRLAAEKLELIELEKERDIEIGPFEVSYFARLNRLIQAAGT